MPYLPPDPPLALGDLPALLRAASWGNDLWFASGRAALLAGLQALSIGSGDEVLLPAYLCESVSTPVEAVGATPRFFPVGRDLGVDPGALEASITPRTRAVVLIHYLGFPGPVEAVREICQRRGVTPIEDCAHALYGRLDEQELGSFGDLAIFSPWKSLPLPDGGLLRVNRPDLRPVAPAEHPSTLRTLARLTYKGLGTVESMVGWTPRLRMLQRSDLRRGMHQRVSAGPVESLAGSEVARRLYAAANRAWVVGRRRRNYARLLEVCKTLAWARPVFEELPVGVCPLGLPLLAEDRDQYRDRLLSHGVNVRTYWEHLPAGVDLEQFPDAAWVSDRILVLPVHQRLPSDHVEWLARLLPRIG